MRQISRRNFVKGIGAMPLALGAASQRRRDGAPRPLRHRHPARPGDAGDTPTPSARCRRYPNMSRSTGRGSGTRTSSTARPPRPTKSRASSAPRPRRCVRLAKETWNTCQSHSGQNPNNFLPWHRMFVFYFEQIVRQVSGRAGLRAALLGLHLRRSRQARRSCRCSSACPDDPVFGVPLPRPNAATLANSGQPIQSNNQPADPMDIGGPMGKTNYSMVGHDVRASAARSIPASTAASTCSWATSSGMGAVPYCRAAIRCSGCTTPTSTGCGRAGTTMAASIPSTPRGRRTASFLAMPAAARRRP